jgi:hypothetical protein
MQDRLSLDGLDLLGRLGLQLRTLLAPTPETFPLGAHNGRSEGAYASRPISLLDLMKYVRESSGSSVDGPKQNAFKMPSGFEYRAIPAAVWASMSPTFLAEDTADSVDMSALAWAGASEALDPGKYPQYVVAIMEAICNAAVKSSISVHSRVTMQGLKKASGGSFEAPGHYARQSGRWCSSFQRPTIRHACAARAVLLAHREGKPYLGHGATRWIDCRVMDKGKQNGKALSYDAAGIVRKWGGEGYEAVTPIRSGGELLVDPYVLMLFRKVARADVARGLAIVEEGRRRWKISAR